MKWIDQCNCKKYKIHSNIEYKGHLGEQFQKEKIPTPSHELSKKCENNLEK